MRGKERGQSFYNRLVSFYQRYRIQLQIKPEIRLYIQLSWFIHRTTMEILDWTFPSFFLYRYSGCEIPFSHEFGQPLPCLVAMLNRHAMLFFARSDRIEYSEMVILTRRNDHLTRLIEKGRVHRQGVCILVHELGTFCIFHLIVLMGLVGTRQGSDIPQPHRPAQ